MASVRGQRLRALEQRNQGITRLALWLEPITTSSRAPCWARLRARSPWPTRCMPPTWSSSANVRPLRSCCTAGTPTRRTHKVPGCRHGCTEWSWCLHELCKSQSVFCSQDMESCVRAMLPCELSLRGCQVGRWRRPVTRVHPARGSQLACNHAARRRTLPRAGRRGAAAARREARQRAGGRAQGRSGCAS